MLYLWKLSAQLYQWFLHHMYSR